MWEGLTWRENVVEDGSCRERDGRRVAQCSINLMRGFTPTVPQSMASAEMRDEGAEHGRGGMGGDKITGG